MFIFLFNALKFPDSRPFISKERIHKKEKEMEGEVVGVGGGVVGEDEVELSNLSLISTTDSTDADQDKQPPQEVVGVVGGRVVVGGDEGRRPWK